MSFLDQIPSANKTSTLAFWSLLAVGLVLMVTVFYLLIHSNPFIFVSTWDEENSNFYDNATRSLRIFSLNPASPTAVVFWDRTDPDSHDVLRALTHSPASLRIYGVHLANTEDSLAVRKSWLKLAPHRASMMMDRSEILQTSFRVRETPSLFIILPKQKKVYSFIGNLNWRRHGHRRMLEIIKSE